MSVVPAERFCFWLEPLLLVEVVEQDLWHVVPASLAAHQCHVEGESTLNFPHVPEGMVVVRHRQADRAKNLEPKCFIREVIHPNVCSVVDHIARLQVCEAVPTRQGLRLLVVRKAELEHVRGGYVWTRHKPHHPLRVKRWRRSLSHFLAAGPPASDMLVDSFTIGEWGGSALP